MLCINCILEEGHKSHEMASLSKGRSVESRRLDHTAAECRGLAERLRNLKSNIENHLEEVNELAVKNLNIIDSIFAELRHILDEREEELKKQLRAQLEAEERRMEDKKKKLKQQLKAIERFNLEN